MLNYKNYNHIYTCSFTDQIYYIMLNYKNYNHIYKCSFTDQIYYILIISVIQLFVFNVL